MSERGSGEELMTRGDEAMAYLRRNHELGERVGLPISGEEVRPKQMFKALVRRADLVCLGLPIS
jgi:hypothetical protein